MSDLNARALEAFPTWLKSLGDDVTLLAATLGDEALSEQTKRTVAGSINYLFKSLDLIPDGIEDLGFIDDAFVLRVAASLADKDASGASGQILGRLGEDAKLLQEFLGDDYARLEAYVRSLAKGAARGRTVDEIIADAEVRSAFLSEVSGWSADYSAPTFTRDDRTLVKLKAFLDTKLPKLGSRRFSSIAARSRRVACSATEVACARLPRDLACSRRKPIGFP